MSRILVVDDEVEICLLLTRYLTKQGCNASFSLSIAEALVKISIDPYDLLFIDLNLKDGSGYDLINFLQKSDSHSKVIVISAYDGERQKALQVGANIFLAKPFTMKAIDESLISLSFLSK